MKKILLDSKKIFEMLNVKNEEEYNNIPFEEMYDFCKKYMCYELPMSATFVVWDKSTSKKDINSFFKEIAYENLTKDVDLANEILEEILEEEDNIVLDLLYDNIKENKKNKIKNKLTKEWIKLQKENIEEVGDLFDSIVCYNWKTYLLTT